LNNTTYQARVWINKEPKERDGKYGSSQNTPQRMQRHAYLFPSRSKKSHPRALTISTLEKEAIPVNDQCVWHDQRCQVQND